MGRQYNSRQRMGQQDSKPASSMPSSRRINYTPTIAESPHHPPAQVIKPRPVKRVHCEGLLRLQTTPFKNCIEIQTEGEVLFLQNIETTLKQLLDTRLDTNKLFMVQDIERLIEEVTFTLAYLQQNGLTYKDIHPDNIFYDKGSFKMLPNELCAVSTYQRIKQGTDVYPSPELIIGYRSGEEDVNDEEILEVANVFTLGMIMLEVTTLLPSSECYDPVNFDILDDVIGERLALTTEYYGATIGQLIQQMLDYDYEKRRNMKNLSIWVNRQLQASRVEEAETVTNETMAGGFANSKVVDRSDNRGHQKEKSRVKAGKNNSVYMGPVKEPENRDERNKIYINQGAEDAISRVFSRQNSRRPAPNGKDKNPYEISSRMDRVYSQQDFSEQENEQPIRERMNHLYQPTELHLKKNALYDKSPYQRQPARRLVKEQTNPYRHQDPPKQLRTAYQPHQPEPNPAPLRQMTTNFYPKVDDILGPSKAVPQQSAQNDWSLGKLRQRISHNKNIVQQLQNIHLA